MTRIDYEIKTTILKKSLRARVCVCVCVCVCCRVYMCVHACLHVKYLFEDVFRKLRFTKDMRGIILKEVLS